MNASYWCWHEDTVECPAYALDDEHGHYRCTTCGSKFPLIGDTALWLPMLVECVL